MSWGLLQASRVYCAGDLCTMRCLLISEFLVYALVSLNTAA
jgi:hypothetical protein